MTVAGVAPLFTRYPTTRTSNATSMDTNRRAHRGISTTWVSNIAVHAEHSRASSNRTMNVHRLVTRITSRQMYQGNTGARKFG